MLVWLVRHRASHSCRKPVIHLVALGTAAQPACGLDLPGRPVVERLDSNEIECSNCSVIYAARRLKEDEARENYDSDYE